MPLGADAQRPAIGCADACAEQRGAAGTVDDTGPGVSKQDARQEVAGDDLERVVAAADAGNGLMDLTDAVASDQFRRIGATQAEQEARQALAAVSQAMPRLCHCLSIRVRAHTCLLPGISVAKVRSAQPAAATADEMLTWPETLSIFGWPAIRPAGRPGFFGSTTDAPASRSTGGPAAPRARGSLGSVHHCAVRGARQARPHQSCASWLSTASCARWRVRAACCSPSHLFRPEPCDERGG